MADQLQAREQARLAEASGKASRDELRAMLAESKANTRIYAKRDWVLRHRPARKAYEPYYSTMHLTQLPLAHKSWLL